MKYLNVLLFALIFSCSSTTQQIKYEADTHDFPSPVDTRSRVIEYQEKRVYNLGTVSATNDFPSGRINDFKQKNDSTYQLTISPENTPINPSPWYAFKIWAVESESVYIELHYGEHGHRYDPKVSTDGEIWELLDSTAIYLTIDSINTMKLDIGPDTLWVAAQEIQDHRRVGKWVNQLNKSEWVQTGTAGESPQGRSLYYLNISKGEFENKPTVLIISRQHPPEVTGYFAMRSFVETIVNNGAQNGFLDKFRVMVYPLMNPDGVDLGHFRHNTGGVDLNRDWAVYNQPEVRQVANHMVKETKINNNNVVLGLDFHSTYRDVYYTFDESVNTKLPDFTKVWLARIKIEIGIEDINERPSGLGSPVSKGWFYKQFGAESITYEIGDQTPREFIVTKGRVSAEAMMEILMEQVEN